MADVESYEVKYPLLYLFRRKRQNLGGYGQFQGGLGGEAAVNIFPDLNFRAGFGVFSLDYDNSINDVDYNFNVDLSTVPLMLDWYPFHGGFHLSGGIVLNNTDIDFCESGTPGPAVLGHEGAGIVEEVGRAVKDVGRGPAAPARRSRAPRGASPSGGEGGAPGAAAR